jgi:hypothetical protein
MKKMGGPMPDKNVIIRVELRGEPGGDTYKQLHDLMSRELKWNNVVVSDTGAVLPLPSATYSGSTDSSILDLASNLQSRIVREIWNKGARVLVIEWNSWGESTTNPW